MAPRLEPSSSALADANFSPAWKALRAFWQGFGRKGQWQQSFHAAIVASNKSGGDVSGNAN